MEQKLLEAIRVHYLAEAARAEANLLNYFKNPSGVGEHSDVVGEMVKLINDLAVARNGLVVIGSLTQQGEAESTAAPSAPTESTD